MIISKGTIVRTIILIIVLINMILQKIGVDLINVSDNQIAQFIEMIISIAAILAAWWKNNSFSEKAKKADLFLQNLKNSESYEEEKDIDHTVIEGE